MRPLLSRIADGEVLVADGAMGTQLMERGLLPGQCPEALNLTHLDWLQQIARLYLEAGAEIIQTNTFGGSPLQLARHGLDHQTEAVNRLAVEAARSAVGTRAYVSGSCGPSGRTLLPYGDVAPEAVYESFVRQFEVLIDAGIDIVCIETMTDLKEAQLAIRAAKAVGPTLPVMATMTFDPTPRGFFTIMGIDVAHATAGLVDAGADVVGSNCGHGIETMVAVAAAFRRHTTRPLLIQANAGLPHLVDDRPVYPEAPAFMADKARALINLGVSVIGGCCGTTPAHVRAIRAVVDEAKRSGPASSG